MARRSADVSYYSLQLALFSVKKTSRMWSRNDVTLRRVFLFLSFSFYIFSFIECFRNTRINYYELITYFMIIVLRSLIFSDRLGVMRWFKKGNEWQQRSWYRMHWFMSHDISWLMPFCECHEGYASLFVIVSADNLRDSSDQTYRCTGALVLGNMRHSKGANSQ